MRTDPATRIATFARRQIEAARTLNQPVAVTFRAMGAAVTVSEPEACLSAFVARNLACVLPVRESGKYRIICRVGAGFLADHPDLAMFAEINDLAFESALQQVGLMGRLNRTPLVWDLFDPALRLGLRLQLATEALPDWEATAPIANFLGWIAREEGHSMLHAATLASGARGCLLVGQGGSGKSGTTLGGILNGMQTVGDDYVFVSSKAPFMARPVYRTMKQDDTGLRRCGLQPDAARFGGLNWQGKRVFDIDRLNPGALAEEFAVHAIVLPRVTGQDVSVLTPALPAAAFVAIMPSSLAQLSGDRRARFMETGALTRNLPCRRLDLGTDPGEVAGTLCNFLAGGDE